MSRNIRAVIALILGIVAVGMQDQSRAQAQRQEAPIKPSETPIGIRYLGVDEIREWTYEATFDTPRIFYYPYFVEPAGLVATNITHGSLDLQLKDPKVSTIAFSVKALGPYKEGNMPVALDAAGERLWSATSVCRSNLAVVRSGSGVPSDHPWTGNGLDVDGQWKPLQPFTAELLALELRISPCSKDNKPIDWVLSEILGMVPVNGSSGVSRYGWVSAPAGDSVTVPAGTYSRVIYSKFPRGGRGVPEHQVESWLAEGVGLIKYRVSQKGVPVYTVVLKTVRKIA